VRLGGLDKLTVQNSPVVSETQPTALRMANRGLREEDREDSEQIKPEEVQGISVVRGLRTRVRSPYADQERQVNGIGGDFLAMEGYELTEGRVLSGEDVKNASSVAVLGQEAAKTFFPDGQAVGATIRVGDTPVQVVGVLK